MKITREQLKKVVKECLVEILREGLDINVAHSSAPELTREARRPIEPQYMGVGYPMTPMPVRQQPQIAQVPVQTSQVGGLFDPPRIPVPEPIFDNSMVDMLSKLAFDAPKKTP